MNKIGINEITDIINPKTVATLSGAVVNENNTFNRIFK